MTDPIGEVMGRKKRPESKKRRQRLRKEAARSGIGVEELRHRLEHGTGKGQVRNSQSRQENP